MLALALLAAVPVFMWLVQAVLLMTEGRSPRARIGGSDLPERVKLGNRVATYAAFAGVLLGYPLLRGESPLAFYARRLPLDGREQQLWFGLVVALFYLSLMYAAWLLTDNLRIDVRQRPAALVKRLAAVPVTAALAATVEELLFRAVVLQGLLDDFGVGIALPVGVAVFAGAHYVRSVKRYWTLVGHLGLGLLLCTAYVCSGALWLPIGIHAGGILLIMAMRPLARYTGPAWLVGASIYPYAGVLGVIALLVLTLDIWSRIGGSP